jgi:peptidoglycan/LPS O-acetylase OafA/YrhL
MITVFEPATKQTSCAPSSAVLESHLPSLDGMRAISILLVLGAHFISTANRATAYTEYLGPLGVFIFFVISGLLITWLMIREREATGAFSLRDFYVRRFLRILPVFWLLILTVSLLKSFHVIEIRWLDIFRAFTFTHNYPLTSLHPQCAIWLGHTWSLSLEEQFYLVWPSLFAVLPRRFSPRLAVILALSGPILRALDYILLPSLRGHDAGGFESYLDVLMTGCACAFLLNSPVWRERIRKIPTWPTLAASAFFLAVAGPMLLFHFPRHSLANMAYTLVFPTLQAFAIALALLVVVAGKQGWAFRVLNARIPTYIGKLSYSLYIWQQLFLVHRPMVSIFSLLGRLAGLYLAAFCSFNFIERPFLRLRSKFRHGVTV